MRRLALLAFLALGACNDPCEETTCPSGTYCASAGCVADCRYNEECSPAACDPTLECCSTARFCGPDGRCVSETVDVNQCSEEAVFPPDGWDAPPGRGLVYIVDAIGFAGPGVGRNVDGRCDPSGCIDNALGGLAELSNDQLRQGLLGGEMLLAIEIAGIDAGYRGFDRSVTVKIYAVRDADEPFFPANNFKVPPGHTTCCEFRVYESSLDERGVARNRIPARIVNGQLETTEAVDLGIDFAVCVPPFPRIEIGAATISGHIVPGFKRLEDVLLTGAFTASSLARIANPYCRVVSPRCPNAVEGATLIELAAAVGAIHPDIDLDGDGRECIYDLNGDGLDDTCCDGTGDRSCPGGSAPCPANRILPIVEGDPGSCRRSPRMADGYSVAVAVSAVEARFVSE